MVIESKVDGISNNSKEVGDGVTIIEGGEIKVVTTKVILTIIQTRGATEVTKVVTEGTRVVTEGTRVVMEVTKVVMVVGTEVVDITISRAVGTVIQIIIRTVEGIITIIMDIIIRIEEVGEVVVDEAGVDEVEVTDDFLNINQPPCVVW